LAQPQGPLPQPLPLFPPDNWWNADVRQAPVDPRSSQFLSFVGPDRGLHPDFGGDADSHPEIYGLVYLSVPGTQPLVPVDFVEYPDESDAGAPGRPPGYPIPEAAKTAPKWIEGGYPGNIAADGDRHLLIVDRDRRILYELYHVFWHPGRGIWEAGSGATWPLSENRRRPEGWTSADAAGMAILPGLVRYDEVFGPDPIQHAFRVTVRRTNGFVYPASHRAGDTSEALPMGARLRLKANVGLAHFPANVRKIFEAMKNHGLIVTDNGTDLYVQGTYDTRWDNDVLNPAFAQLRGDDFEVLQLGWKPASDPPPAPAPPPSPERLTAVLLGPRRVELRWVDRAQNETAFQVEARRGAGAFALVRTLPPDANRAVLRDLKPGSRYAFRVRAINAAGASAYSNRAVLTTPH
jgi:hypothetical protein